MNISKIHDLEVPAFNKRILFTRPGLLLLIVQYPVINTFKSIFADLNIYKRVHYAHWSMVKDM